MVASTRAFSIGLIGLALVLGCAPQQGRDTSTTGGGSTSNQAPLKTVVLADRHEPTDLAAKIPASGGSDRSKRPYNAALALIDGSGAPRPYLAAALPQLNTDSWRLFPDGRMETTYGIRAGLTWHDGHPLDAADFLFAWRVYSSSLGVFSATPQDQVDEMVTPDAQTMVIRWRAPVPNAGSLGNDTLDPLPRHILEPAFEAFQQDPAARDAFLNHPFWAYEYVGAGPFKLEKWEHGVSIEGTAFDGHALGRPKIDRIIGRFWDDENTILTNVLAGTVDLATRTTLRFEHGKVLKRDWAPAGKGSVLYDPGGPLFSLVQFRPEYQKTPELLDLRVRRALAHAVDKQTIVDTLFEGDAPIADTLVARQEPVYPAVDRVITKYAYDPRRSEQLMVEAGLTRDRDGFFASPTSGRFRPDYQALESVDYERVQVIAADTWRRAGLDVQQSVLPNEQVRVNQVRHTFPGIATPGAGSGAERRAAQDFTGPQIGTPNNRWSGSNRGGWVNPEHDRLFEAFNATLDRAERNQQLAQMMKGISEQVPVLPYYHNTYVLAVVSALTGFDLGTPATTNYWNIHEWEMK